MSGVAAAYVGCKVSQADSEKALTELVAAGALQARDSGEADLVVVHTCCVTAEAERKSRRLVRRSSRSGRRVLVSGCAAVLHPEQFAAPGVEVMEAPDWAAVAAGLGAVTAPNAATAATAHTRLVLKVQDGCRGACSFCVVRLVRGRPRSRPFDQALSAARAGLARGSGEVVLSGIDLGGWRDGEKRLPHLVEALAELPELRRLRLSSLEPHHVDERLLDALVHPRVARHLHLPLQSADDAVLAAMCRPYTFARYVLTATRLRERLGDGMLSTDVIVGFPTEDDAAFKRTLAALESGLFGRVHVFAFSARPGTAAAQLPPLPAAVVKARMTRALAAAEAAARSARRAVLGRPAEVILEEKRDGLWRGYSSEYIRYCLRVPAGVETAESGLARPGVLARAVAESEHPDGVLGDVKELCA